RARARGRVELVDRQKHQIDGKLFGPQTGPAKRGRRLAGGSLHRAARLRTLERRARTIPEKNLRRERTHAKSRLTLHWRAAMKLNHARDEYYWELSPEEHDTLAAWIRDHGERNAAELGALPEDPEELEPGAAAIALDPRITRALAEDGYSVFSGDAVHVPAGL